MKSLQTRLLALEQRRGNAAPVIVFVDFAMSDEETDAAISKQLGRPPGPADTIILLNRFFDETTKRSRGQDLGG